MGSSLEHRSEGVTVRTMPDAFIAGTVLGFFGGLVLAGLVVGIGVPVGPALGAWWNLVFAGVWLGGGAVLAAVSSRITTLRFEPDQIVITRPTGWRRRFAWEHVESVHTVNSANEDGDVTARWLALTVLRNPDIPVPDAPTVIGEFMRWRKEHFRTVRLGVPIPVKQADARSRFARMRRRTREQVLRELESRGLTL